MLSRHFCVPSTRPQLIKLFRNDPWMMCPHIGAAWPTRKSEKKINPKCHKKAKTWLRAVAPTTGPNQRSQRQIAAIRFMTVSGSDRRTFLGKGVRCGHRRAVSANRNKNCTRWLGLFFRSTECYVALGREPLARRILTRVKISSPREFGNFGAISFYLTTYFISTAPVVKMT